MNDIITDVTYERLARELRKTRIFCLVSSLLTVGLLICSVLLILHMKPLYAWMEQTQPILVELAELDMDSVNLTMAQMNHALESIDWKQVSDAVVAVDWKQMSDAVGSIDWKTVSDSLSNIDVDAINKAVDGLDTKELSEALETLNNTVDTLQAIGDKVKSFTGISTK
jgi:hypothetical protein